LQLGGTNIVPLGLADEQEEFGSVFQHASSFSRSVCRSDTGIDRWVKELWSVLLKMYPLPFGLSAMDDFEL